MTSYLSKSILLAGICFASCTEPNPTTPLAEPDRQFMKMISYSNYAEISAGEIANKNGDSMVRWFGTMMKMDHEMAQAELKTLALQKNYGLPGEPDSMSSIINRNIDTLSGRTFSIAYLSSQLTAHNNAIAILENEIKKGWDRDLRIYAQKYLSKVIMHKQQADSLYKRL